MFVHLEVRNINQRYRKIVHETNVSHFQISYYILFTFNFIFNEQLKLKGKYEIFLSDSAFYNYVSRLLQENC